VILLLAACRADEAPPSSSGSTSSTTITTTTTTTSPAPDVPWIGEALADRCPDPPHPDLVPSGDDLRRVTLADATARCNDGSAPVLYVRAATDPAHDADWVVHLMGGGYCDSYETCAARWCAEDNYSASNMSTAWAPETGGGRGVTSEDPRNPLAGWNVAELYYCASDLWTGQQQLVLDGEAPYRVAFQGHQVLEAQLDALGAGVTSDDGALAVALTDPGTIVFSGSSAGAYGAVIALPSVVERYPSARVVAAIDSIFSPAREVIDPDLAAAWEDLIEKRYEIVAEPIYAAWVDPGCLAQGVEAWRCYDVDWTMQHLPAEALMHHDLRDPVLYDTVSMSGLTDLLYAEAGEATLRRYADEGVAVHGSACGDHTSLDDERAYFGQLVVDAVAGGPARAPVDVLGSALAGAPAEVVDEPYGSGSTCP
jgi:hypothetical protein